MKTKADEQTNKNSTIFFLMIFAFVCAMTAGVIYGYYFFFTNIPQGSDVPTPLQGK